MRFITFYLVHAALYPLVPAGVMLLEERPEVLFGLSPVQVEHLLFLGIYHQFGILVPLLYGELVDDRDLGRIRNGASTPRHRGISPFRPHI